MKLLLIAILMLSQPIKAEIVPEWYDTGVGDKTKTVLEVNCGSKQYQLVLKKDEVVKKEHSINKWLDMITLKCLGESK